MKKSDFYERLTSQDPQQLSDAELLAFFLCRALPLQEERIRLAYQMLEKFGSLKQVLAVDLLLLSQLFSIEMPNLMLLQHSKHLMQRCVVESIQDTMIIHDSKVAYAMLAHLRCKQQEIFGAIFMDRGYRVLARPELFVGTIDAVVAYPREIIKVALGYNATYVILFHNHPGSSSAPSQSDQRLTKKIAKLLNTLGVELIDHIIVGNDGYHSVII